MAPVNWNWLIFTSVIFGMLTLALFFNRKAKR